MKALRIAMTDLHTWGGLLISWLLFAVLWTGTVAVFEREVSHWMQPERQFARPAASQMENAEAALRYLRQERPKAPVWRIELPSQRIPSLVVSWPERPGEWQSRVIDARTGTALMGRDTEGGDHFADFHKNLHAGTVGIWLVALTGLMMLAASVSGVIIHKKIFKDFFTFRPRGNSQRSWLDGHNVSGVLLLPFHLMIAYTGLACYFAYYMPAALNTHFDGNADALRAQAVQSYRLPPAKAPAPAFAPIEPMFRHAERILGEGRIQLMLVNQPADANASVQFFRDVDDRVAYVADHANFRADNGALLGSQTSWNGYVAGYRALVGLHVAPFGGNVVRWLYLLAGIGGCVMVASGLVLFTVKRRPRYAKAGPAMAAFYAVAERLNVASVAGLLLASAAFLYANRLLPAELDGRATLEIGVFFATWLATLLHALARPVPAAWREQLYGAAFLCLALPLVDAVTAGDALRLSLAAGDRVPLGFDLTVGVIGVALATIARKVRL